MDIPVNQSDTSTASETVIGLSDIHKNYGALEVLKGISLTANRGDVTVLIGSSAHLDTDTRLNFKPGYMR